jgi:hypothetical protein
MFYGCSGTAITAGPGGSTHTPSDRRKEANDDVVNSAAYGGPSETRTPDPLIKSQLLYQLS